MEGILSAPKYQQYDEKYKHDLRTANECEHDLLLRYIQIYMANKKAAITYS